MQGSPGGRRATSPCAGTNTFLRETAGLGKAQRVPSGLACNTGGISSWLIPVFSALRCSACSQLGRSTLLPLTLRRLIRWCPDLCHHPSRFLVPGALGCAEGRGWGALWGTLVPLLTRAQQYLTTLPPDPGGRRLGSCQLGASGPQGHVSGCLLGAGREVLSSEDTAALLGLSSPASQVAQG